MEAISPPACEGTLPSSAATATRLLVPVLTSIPCRRSSATTASGSGAHTGNNQWVRRSSPSPGWRYAAGSRAASSSPTLARAAT